MRSIGLMDAKTAARSPLLGDSLESRLGGVALGHLLFLQAARHQYIAEKKENRLGQSGLWCTGISGDIPIALLELSEGYDHSVLEAYLRLHRTIHSLHVEWDLCILCDTDELQKTSLEAVGQICVYGILGSRGGVFVLKKDDLASETLTLLRAVSRYVSSSSHPGQNPIELPAYTPSLIRPIAPDPMPQNPALLVHGGAFVGDGSFAVDRESPLPYCHILTTGSFGTLVSDSALGYTWAINSRECKLTPWYNDITTDNTGEMLLLSDGESIFDLISGARAIFSEESARWIGRAGKFHSEVKVTLAGRGCAKYIDVTLENQTSKDKILQCAYYTEPTLAVDRTTAQHIIPELSDNNILLLKNPYNTAVKCCAAIGVRAPNESEPVVFTTDRGVFLSGDWQTSSISMQNDPCAAAIVPLRISPGQSVSIRFTLSYGRTPKSALYMAANTLSGNSRKTSSIRIETPDEALNQYINHFSMHQIYHSRIKGRTAFYQCGGAYGFRDQLQDVCAYLLIDPQAARRQIVRCCTAQFEEGDVMHWWHPLPGTNGLRGVRTRFSDDLVWLPYAVSHYISKTGDDPILRVPVRYLSAPELLQNEHEKYIAPSRSGLSEDVFGHCVRALERSWQLDDRGLPLIGCGDWNDGFSSVGLEGRGSSVWLAMFMVITLEGFADICRLRGDAMREELYRERAQSLRKAVDTHCWDGEWYVRAFFDWGGSMGSRHNSECEMDLLRQRFAVLADMPDSERIARGMQNAYDRLVDKKLSLVRLFDPPFVSSHQQPGYVKAYPGGIRENGGQYTHAAVWFAIALIKHGKTQEGCDILRMLNPARRSCEADLSKAYKLEPYYMAADICTNPGSPGRGGWSMYTGAAAWYYRAVLEIMLGFKICGSNATLSPNLPPEWKDAKVELISDGGNHTIKVSI